MGSSDPEVERLNSLSRERLLTETEHMRREVINRSYEAVLLFAKRDQLSFAKLSDQEEGQDLYFYVGQDFLAAPVRENHLWTWSIGLVADTDLGQTGNEKISIYVPVPKEFHDLYQHDIDTIPKPDRIFIEYIDGQGGLNRYELTHENLFRYSTAADTGGDQIHEEDDIGQWLLNSISRRVDSRLPVIAQLQEALINMKVVPQPSKKTDAAT